MNLDVEYTLSLYEELKSIHKSRKSEIFLVQNNIDEKFYIKRVLKEYTIEVYKSLINVKSKYMPTIYEVFEYEDKLIIIEEFINGYTLQEILKRNEYLNEEIVIKYMIDLCDILEKVHNLNPSIIHRDIKPANIIISNDNVLKLIDFDISRIYKDGEKMDTTLLGTKGYASPEQFGFDQTDCRSDIYAMGVMMNVLSTGKHMKEAKNQGVLKDIIIKCTKISAKDRYQTVKELKHDLEKLIIENYDEESKIEENKLIKKVEKVEENLNKKRRHLYDYIPGFRQGKKMNIILSIIWYLFLVIGLIVAKSPIELLQNIIVVGLLLTMYLFYTNFLDIKYKLPLVRSKDKTLKLFGYFLYSFIIFMIYGLLLDIFM
ncbi:serine/threonine protein kinase [Paraclostridium bifermentans]|uniref:serine/threonine protein kinase n=1 Tax=Paraclostridium bifermentans TaxID=1490 RepID=UPI00359C3DD7